VKQLEARHTEHPEGGATLVLAFHFDGQDAAEIEHAAALAQHALYFAPPGSRLAGRIKSLIASMEALALDERERTARMREVIAEEESAPPLSPAAEKDNAP
jgi:hypothetical protein